MCQTTSFCSLSEILQVGFFSPQPEAAISNSELGLFTRWVLQFVCNYFSEAQHENR